MVLFSGLTTAAAPPRVGGLYSEFKRFKVVQSPASHWPTQQTPTQFDYFPRKQIRFQVQLSCPSILIAFRNRLAKKGYFNRVHSQIYKTHFRYISSPRAWRSDDHHVCCLFFPHWLCRNVWKTRKLSWQWNLIQKPVSTNITWFAWIRRIRLTESKRDQVEIDIYLLLRK